MKVFVEGATGAIGKQLVPRLVAVGHEVHGITRSESRQAMLFDDPAPVAEWLLTLGEVLGAKRPMRVPRFVGRLFAGEAGAVMMTEVRGASNAKAKRELAWRPAHPSWRQGFAAG